MDIDGTRTIILENKGATFISATFEIPIGFEISENERIRYFNQFIELFNNIVKKYDSDSVKNIPDFLLIAMRYYYDGSVETKSHDNFEKLNYSKKFLDLVISIECLLNEGDSEINYKIRIRSALILGMFNLESLEIFKELKEMYNNRSKIVHGGKDVFIERVYFYKIQKNISLILKAMTILVFKYSIKKQENLVSLVDEALLDYNKRNLLLKVINENFDDYNMRFTT